MTVKKTALILCLLMGFSAGLQAAELEPSGTPLRKLQRGFLNFALSPVELFYQIKKQNQREYVPGWIVGLVSGSAATVGRASVGVYEMLTASVALPKDYQPVIQPEFVWTKLDEFESGTSQKNLKTRKKR